MFLEYDWTFNVYRPRLGDVFTSWRGWQSFESFEQAQYEIEAAGCKIGRKTDTRTWEIVAA